MSVAELCQTVGRTKGSFYHHFEDHQHFVEELVANWRQENLDTPIEKSSGGGSRGHLSKLTAISAELNPEEEVAIRNLASRHDSVRVTLDLVDNARMDYLALLYRQAGLKPQQAMNAAKIQYAGFVGALYLWPEDFGAHVRKLGKIADELLLRAAEP